MDLVRRRARAGRGGAAPAQSSVAGAPAAPLAALRSPIVLVEEETMMGKLGKVLKAIGRFVNGATKDMLADTRAGGGMSAGDGDVPPDWERKDLGI